MTIQTPSIIPATLSLVHTSDHRYLKHSGDIPGSGSRVLSDEFNINLDDFHITYFWSKRPNLARRSSQYNSSNSSNST